VPTIRPSSPSPERASIMRQRLRTLLEGSSLLLMMGGCTGVVLLLLYLELPYFAAYSKAIATGVIRGATIGPLYYLFHPEALVPRWIPQVLSEQFQVLLALLTNRVFWASVTLGLVGCVPRVIAEYFLEKD